MLDQYTRRARLAPVLLAAVPALVFLGTAVSSPQDFVKVGGAALAAVGLVACGLVRDRGRHVQMRLWQSWGGSPTTRRLRLTGNSDVRAAGRLRSRVEAITGSPLPTQDEERDDPTDADRRYEEAVSALRERTRDHERFPLVFEENMDYGFRRTRSGSSQWARLSRWSPSRRALCS